jgi:hypothetical protein
MLPFIILCAHRVGGLSGSTAGLLFLAQAIKTHSARAMTKLGARIAPS